MGANVPDFLDDFSILSHFGAVEGGGVDRLAGSAADGDQRRWLAELLAQHSFKVERDQIGNLFGFLELNAGAPYVLTGSHLDSQPTAGRFDGAYGVLASLHACLRLSAKWAEEGTVPLFNLAVVDWFNEEGARFKPSMMGSAVFTGKLALEDALATRDVSGISVARALDGLKERGRPVSIDVESYAEIHVQQGRSMEQDGVTIGLVDFTWAAVKYEFEVIGEQSHTGSTAMADRRDALLGASHLVVAARQIAGRFPSGALHTSVGELTVYPNSPVVVASRVRLLLDLRSADERILREAAAMLAASVEEIETVAGVEIVQAVSQSWGVDPYPPEGVELSAAVAEELGLPYARVMTLAGHDSTNLKDIVPTVMLFVPSVEGISHNVRELTSDRDLIAGLEMLTAVLERLANGGLRRAAGISAT